MARKLPKGFKRLPNGKYDTHISLGNDPVTGKRIRRHLVRDSIEELEYAVIQYKMMYLEGKLTTPLETPFKHIFVSYIQERERLAAAGEITNQTHNNQKSMCKTYILSHFEYVENIRDIKLVDCEKFVNKLKVTTELSNNRINKIIDCLRQIFTYAERQNLISDNPTRLLKKLRMDPPKKKDILEPKDFVLLLNSIDENQSFQNLVFKVTLAINYGCGFRISEIAGILKDDLIYTNSGTIEIPIYKSLQNKKGGYDIVSKPKSKSGYRKIVLPKFTQELVELLLEESPKEWEWLLQRTEGVPPYYQKTYNEFLKRQCKSVGLPPITSHNLRHSIASLLMLESNDEIAIQRYMGHSKIEFTRNRYGHEFNDAQNNIAKLIDKKVKEQFLN